MYRRDRVDGVDGWWGRCRVRMGFVAWEDVQEEGEAVVWSGSTCRRASEGEAVGEGLGTSIGLLGGGTGIVRGATIIQTNWGEKEA